MGCTLERGELMALCMFVCGMTVSLWLGTGPQNRAAVQRTADPVYSLTPFTVQDRGAPFTIPTYPSVQTHAYSRSS